MWTGSGVRGVNFFWQRGRKGAIFGLGNQGGVLGCDFCPTIFPIKVKLYFFAEF